MTDVSRLQHQYRGMKEIEFEIPLTLVSQERCRRYLMTEQPVEHTALTTDIESILKLYIYGFNGR